MLSKWFTVDVDSAFGYLHHVDVGSIADISEVHPVFIFRVDVNRTSKSYRESRQGKFISSSLQEPVGPETYACKNTNSAHFSTFHFPLNSYTVVNKRQKMEAVEHMLDSVLVFTFAIKFPLYSRTTQHTLLFYQCYSAFI
jgi:hypothetical protein